MPRTVSLSPPQTRKNSQRQNEKKSRPRQEPMTEPRRSMDKLLEMIKTAKEAEAEEDHTSLSEMLFSEARLAKCFDEKNYTVDHPRFHKAFLFADANKLLSSVLTDKSTTNELLGILKTAMEAPAEEATVDEGAPPALSVGDGGEASVGAVGPSLPVAVVAPRPSNASTLTNSVPRGDDGTASEADSDKLVTVLPDLPVGDESVGTGDNELPGGCGPLWGSLFD